MVSQKVCNVNIVVLDETTPVLVTKKCNTEGKVLSPVFLLLLGCCGAL